MNTLKELFFTVWPFLAVLLYFILGWGVARLEALSVSTHNRPHWGVVLLWPFVLILVFLFG